MKNYIKKYTIMLLLMLLANVSMQAQRSGASKPRLSREQFTEVQARHIARSLALDADKTKLLVQTYMRQQQEIWALGPRLTRRGASPEAEVEGAIEERFKRSQKILDIREKYYKEYSQFLTQSQIRRMYEIERQTMQRLQARGPRHDKGLSRK